MSWRKVKLGNIADFSNGINFGKEAYAKGIKLIGVSNFGNRFYPDYDELEEVREDVVREKDYLQAGDIVFVRSNGNKELVGRSMLIDNLPAKVTFSGFCIRARFRDTKEHNPVFWAYHFKDQGFRRCMSGTAIGANIQNLSQGRLAVYEAEVPDIDTQKRIADILSKYDDLIENNQKQIRLLEEAAQRLYKEWFVDLRFPDYEECKIIDGIPEGWERVHISDVCETIGGGTPSTKVNEYYQDGDIRWITPTDITRNNSLILLDSEKKITKLGLEKSSAKMVPPYTILMTSRASVGYFGICEYEVCTNQGFISCVPYEENVRYFLLYNLMNRIEEIRQKASGSTFLEISKKTFRELEIVLPANNVLEMFDKVIIPYIKQIEILAKKKNKLLQAREKLLPKLMSGEIEVKYVF